MELTKEQKMMQDVISKAWNDAGFKQQLMTEPVAAIEKLTGQKLGLPKDAKLEVYDQSNPKVIYLNIPPMPNMDDIELSDKDLELVAGGSYPFWIIGGCFPEIPPKFPIPDGTAAN
jgi:CheY-like chemotaxis protein